MITSSPELVAISRRWYKAILESGQNTLPNFLSESDLLRFIGTASGENWSGQEVREAVSAYFNEVPDVLHNKELFAEAFERGDIGWSVFVHTVTFANRIDTPVEFRSTLVFSLENGSWKVVHRHTSVPIANQDIMGLDQTAITELVEAAHQGASLGQTEGLASVMFTDVVASSVLANTLGDQVWSARINTHFTTLKKIIEANGGQFVKSLGDGTMSSFSSARSALSAAGDIQRVLAEAVDEPRLSVRIGVHTGDVVQTREDFFGTVVNTAARIATAAGRGEIFVSDVTRELVGNDSSLQFQPKGSHDLSGQASPSILHALNWRS